MPIIYKSVYAKTPEEYLSYSLKGYLSVYIDHNLREKTFSLLKEHQDDNDYVKYNYLTFSYEFRVELGYPVKEKEFNEEALKLAQKGFVHAYNILCFYEKDPAKQKQYLSKAMAINDLSAYFNYGQILYYEEKYKEAFGYFKKAINGPSEIVNYYLAKSYIYGYGVKKNVRRGISLMKKESKKLNYRAKAFMANCYIYSYHKVRRNYEKGFNLAYEAAYQGNKHAIDLIAECYFYGMYVKEDNAKALKWDEYGVSKEIEESYRRMGKYYLNGYGVERDYKKAYEWNKKCYEKFNNFASLADMGYLLERGMGVEKNVEEGLKYINKAYLHQELWASYRLGQHYISVETNYNEAIKYLLQASSIDSAYSLIGYCYFKANRFNEALPYLENCYAKKKYIYAYPLGVMYVEGLHLKKNLNKGTEILKQAAYAGNKHAALYLGVAIIEGKYGIGKNFYQGVQWFEYVEKNKNNKFTNYDIGHACCMLGVAFSEAKYNHVDPVKAKQYFQRAVNLGYEKAKQFLDK